jgi:hypothetical protein
MGSSVCMFVCSIWLAAGHVTGEVGPEPRVFLSVVLDTSPTTTDRWNTRKALLLEAIHSLQAGDRLELITARPGQPKTRMAETLTEPLALQWETATRVISEIPKEWFAGADISRAVNAAHLSLLNKGEGHRCCLLVLSSGKIGDSGLAELRRVAAALRPRGWPICVVCDGEQANRQVLVAGTRGEIELRFTDDAAIGPWLRSVRTPAATDLAVARAGQTPGRAAPPAVTPAQSPPVPVSMPPAAGAGNTKAITIGSSGGKETTDVRIVPLPPARGAEVRERPAPTPPASTKRVESATPSSAPAPQPQGAAPKAKADKPSHPKISVGLIAGAVLVGIGLIGLGLYVLKDTVAVGKLRHSHSPRPDNAESVGSQLVAFVGDRREELGNLEDIQEITIGKGLGCNLYIDEPGVEDRHARIWRRRQGLRVQNTAGVPLVLNGAPVLPKVKADLVLPADMELAPGVTVSLLTEAIAPQMEVEAHEADIA